MRHFFGSSGVGRSPQRSPKREGKEKERRKGKRGEGRKGFTNILIASSTPGDHGIDWPRINEAVRRAELRLGCESSHATMSASLSASLRLRSCPLKDHKKPKGILYLFLSLAGSGSSLSRRVLLLLFLVVDCSSISFCLRSLDVRVFTRVSLPDIVPVEPNTCSENLAILPNPPQPSPSPLWTVHRPVNCNV